MYIKIFTLVITLSIACITHGQWMVSGTIQNEQRLVTPINVALVKNSSGIIVAYTVTNKKGEYTLTYNGNFIRDSFAVQIQSFGFAKQKTVIKDPSQRINLNLQTEPTELPKVSVKNKPKSIRAQGDTITYRVDDFTNPTDRVIGDVIKKLPGVDVTVDGKITYQGKPISRFYIDGDNLLDDKYNIATNSVPSNMIISVQVLDKHQPIRALENIQYSESPAMNIITKESARKKLINDGNASLGDPGLYDVTLNTLFFSKQMKFINYYKLNNAGIDLNKEVISHNFSENQRKIGFQPSPNLLSINQPTPPGLSKKRYLLNNSGLPNINDLVNLSRGVQLRINAYYLYDQQHQYVNRKTTFYSPADTIHFFENQNSKNTTNTFRTQINLNINDSGYYLNNTLVLENQSQNGGAELNNYIHQKISGSNTTISNELNYIKVLRSKQVVELYSYFENNTNPQTLSVEPGLYDLLVNQGKAYKQLNQFANIPGFFTTNYITLRKKLGALINVTQAGFSSQAQQLFSFATSFQNNGSTKQLGDSFYNHIDWQRNKIYIQQEFQLKYPRWDVNFAFPLNYQHIAYSDPLQPLIKNSADLVPFNPRIQLRVLSGKQNSFIFSGFIDQTLGNIEDVSRGFIFTNYRNTFSHQSSLVKTNNKGISANYYFKKAIEGFFMNFGLLHISAKSNTLINSRITNNLQQIGFIDYPNNMGTYQSASVSINKYIFKWNTDIKFSVITTEQTVNQQQNGQLFNLRNTNYSYKLKIDTRLPGGLYAAYTGILLKSSIRQSEKNGFTLPSISNATQVEQQFELSLVMSKNFYFKLNAENYYNHLPGSTKNNFLFLDANATIRINKLNSDVQIFVNNIIGKDTFAAIYLASNIITESRYTIRPRTIFLKFNYRF